MALTGHGPGRVLVLVLAVSRAYWKSSRRFQKSRNMELLEQELNDPNSPRPPPLPPRPAVMPLPGVHGAAAAEVPAGSASTMTSRSPGSQSAADDGSVEQRYVSSPVGRPRAARSAASAASQLRSSGRRGHGHALGRSRTCSEDAPPALPPPRKFSLPLDALGDSSTPRSRSPGGQQESPSTPVRSPRSSPQLPHASQP